MAEVVVRSKKETLKWSFIVLVLLSGVVLNVVFAKISVIIRLVAWIFLAIFAVFLAYHTQKGKEAWGFMQAAQVELRKVVWPTRRETLQTTLVVVVMVIIMSMLLWGIDSVLLWAVSLLTGRKG
ncbi:MAG: preprotein translocase subunit SecE [Gammaproteobacteria bacterium]|nr:preprotein translocase subunit SecE [Gammaproteobacteria bacterium]